MDYSKLILSLISIFAGWMLAQFTGVLKDYLYKRKIRKCLVEELTELQSELERTLLIYSRQLQIHALKGIDNASPVLLSNHIFQNYYKDAVLSLNKDQRISLQLIHTLIRNINTGIGEHREITSKLQDKHMLEGPKSIGDKEGAFWGNKVISEFHNVAAAIWHIRFHLANSKSPDLSPYTKDHESYLKYLENVESEVQNIFSAATKLDRKEFEKMYDPESFAKQFL